MIKLHYTQGPKKVSKGSDKLAPFLRELKQLELPRDVNNPIYFFNNQFRTDEMKEILRRFGAVYHTGSEARFNLAISQLKKYPDFLSPDSDNESQLWVSAVFVDNALIYCINPFLTLFYRFRGCIIEFILTLILQKPIHKSSQFLQIPFRLFYVDVRGQIY